MLAILDRCGSIISTDSCSSWRTAGGYGKQWAHAHEVLTDHHAALVFTKHLGLSKRGPYLMKQPRWHSHCGFKMCSRMKVYLKCGL